MHITRILQQKQLNSIGFDSLSKSEKSKCLTRKKPIVLFLETFSLVSSENESESDVDL